MWPKFISPFITESSKEKSSFVLSSWNHVVKQSTSCRLPRLWYLVVRFYPSTDVFYKFTGKYVELRHGHLRFFEDSESCQKHGVFLHACCTLASQTVLASADNHICTYPPELMASVPCSTTNYMSMASLSTMHLSYQARIPKMSVN